jgi:rubrerythrin
MGSKDNLQAAFAGESQANRKYLAFAQKAEKDGFPNVAKLFRAAAQAETVHAHKHLRTMGGINSTADNLQVAIDGEGYEFKEMYPEFLEEAKKEGDKQAQTSFEYAMEAEKNHHEMYNEAKNAVKQGNDLPDRKIYVCSVCGHTTYDEAPDACPVCGAKKERFDEIQ